MTYEEYLRSAAWQTLRQQVIGRDEGLCQTCLLPGQEVHHKTYLRLFHEPLSDLILLCGECHEAITDVFRRRRYAAEPQWLPPTSRAPQPVVMSPQWTTHRPTEFLGHGVSEERQAVTSPQWSSSRPHGFVGSRNPEETTEPGETR